MPEFYHKSYSVRNVPFGIHEHVTGETDDSFIGRTTGSRGQLCRRYGGDVGADDGKIAVVEFPNIGARTRVGAPKSISERIKAKAF